jgi:hypothetical protein
VERADVAAHAPEDTAAPVTLRPSSEAQTAQRQAAHCLILRCC